MQELYLFLVKEAMKLLNLWHLNSATNELQFQYSGLPQHNFSQKDIIFIKNIFHVTMTQQRKQTSITFLMGNIFRQTWILSHTESPCFILKGFKQRLRNCLGPSTSRQIEYTVFVYFNVMKESHNTWNSQKLHCKQYCTCFKVSAVTKAHSGSL